MKTIKTTLLAITVLVLLWSGIMPKDRFTWFLETFPVWVGLPLLMFFDAKSRITPLLFILICIHAMVLCVGGKYTYAEVPFGFWLQDAFSMARNPYDRIGHFFQGFVPVFLAREVLIRKRVLPRNFWLFLFSICICLSFSAFYELIEWSAAVFTDEGAAAFLGTQGDQWDTQWDMFMALVGALTGWMALSHFHDKQINKNMW